MNVITSSDASATLDMRETSARGAVAPGSVVGPPIRSQVSESEWQARVDLAACYRLMVTYGMTDMIYNHITMRVPGAPDHFLINAYGLHYSEICASNLHKIDHDGNFALRANTHYGINHAGYVIHSAVHRARQDVSCVIHSHTRAGVAVSAMEAGLLPISLTAMRFMGHLGYHDCEGSVLELAERDRIVGDLGMNNAMVLRNHGLLTCGASIAQAFNAHYMLEMSCRIQVDALSAGAGGLRIPTKDVVDRTAWLFQPEVRRPYGDMEWDAMLRLLDRQDGSFRD